MVETPSPDKLTPTRIISSQRESQASDLSGELPETADETLPTYFEPGMFKSDDIAVIPSDYVGVEEVVIEEQVQEQVVEEDITEAAATASTSVAAQKKHHHHHSKVYVNFIQAQTTSVEF